MSRPLLAALALAATVLAASGCGESTGTTKPLTRAELIVRGDAICRRINARLAATTVGKGGGFGQLMPPLAAYEHAAVLEMRKLTPPASMADGWGQVIGGAQMLADATAKIGEYAKANNNTLPTTPPTRAAFTAAGAGTRQMIAAAHREGFDDCARTP